MIRMIQSMSAGHAKSYYTDALSKADYYIDGQELNGTFQGRLSKRLGIEGSVTREAFFALCENRHPATGSPLTPRNRKGRTVGYDVNFHVPKSVSILNALSKDDHIVKAFRSCVAATMQEVETDARARVRKNGAYEDRKTGELLWADFVHQTARPVDGYAPDPHLHAHCFVFNVTWDETEQQLKAGQFRQINKEMPYYQALFHKRLADELVRLGYSVRPTEKSFEVVGIPNEVIALFSKRTDEIGRVAKEKGITDAKELSELGARTRSKKQSGLSMAELKAEWRSQIMQSEQGKTAPDNQPVRYLPEKDKTVHQPLLSAQDCINYSLAHHFERASVVPFNKLAATAIHHSIGAGVSAEDILAGLKDDSRIIQVQEGGSLLCTTKEVLREEQRMVQLGNAGRNRFAPLYAQLPAIKADGQQGVAIAHILSTTDRVSIVRGAAGAGKTTLAKEAVQHINNAGKRVMFVAPTSRASRGVLRDEGFRDAETVAKFLASEDLQQQVKDQVLWVDEAGMLGTRDMAALLEVATKQNARLILGGDTRQHASVVRGDALRILNTVGGIKVAEVDKIYRQKDEAYRQAVADLSKGDILAGFGQLESIGAIREADPTNPFAALIDDYMASLKEGKDVLIIAPTHQVGDKVNEKIREALKDAGMTGKRQLEAASYKSYGWTAAEKSDSRNLRPGMVVQFNQNRKGIRRGSAWVIDSVEQRDVMLTNAKGDKAKLDLDKPEQFDVYKHSVIPVAKGDKLMITRNGFDRQKQRLDSGLVFEVVSVSRKNGIVLQNPKGKIHHHIDSDFGNIAYAHCVTSHKAQGKTVDDIFIAQPVATFPATNAKQFYVSVSRAREKVRIYTDDKEALLDYALKQGDRTGAMELVKNNPDFHMEHVLIQQRQKEVLPSITPATPHPDIDKGRDMIIQPTDNLEDYEPGF